MRRIISCFTNSYGRFGPREAMTRVRAAGIDHVELAIKTDGVGSLFGEEPILTDRSGPREVNDVRHLLEAAGVSLSSCNITSGNPLDDAVVAVTLRKLQLAADLGVDCVVAGAGEGGRPDQQSKLFHNLRRIGDAAGDLGLITCFETHPGLCRNAKAMVRTMEALDHPCLRLNFDTGNLLYYNEGADVVSGLTAVLPWVRHVHLKDHNGCAGDWHFPALGAGGAVDFVAARDVLDSAGFAGPYSVEIEGLQTEPPRSREQTHQRVAESAKHLRRCGYFD
ncbi:MAG: sugar phosphate isomerase/epimerase family protein [Planctomycetaceae bacterium]